MFPQMRVIELINHLQTFNPDLMLSFGGEGESFSVVEAFYEREVWLNKYEGSSSTVHGLHIDFAF